MHQINPVVLPKAIQRLEGVEKVRARVKPPLAEVMPRAGAWLEADRLRRAVKDAGFKPGDVRRTIFERLTEWQGQPAVRLTGSERVVILQARPDTRAVYERARRAVSEAAGQTVEVEGQLIDRAAAEDKASPAALRIERLAIQGW